MIRMAIIGAGQAGLLHARAVSASPRAAVTHVVDADRDRGERLAADTGARYSSDYHAVLGEVDAVSICVPHAALAGIAIDTAVAGVHMILEKPMATTLEDADRVIAAARAAGIVLLVGFVHRYRPEALRAHQVITSGAIGEPRFLTDHSAAGGQAAWPAWVQRAQEGGGALLYSGVHRIDRARWLLGRSVTTVQGSTAALLPGSDADSSFAALLQFQGAVRAAITHHYHAIAVPPHWETAVYGTEGVLRMRTGESLEVISSKGTWREDAGPDRRFDNEVVAFLDAIDGKGNAIPSGEDGRAALEIALAIIASHATGRRISVQT